MKIKAYLSKDNCNEYGKQRTFDVIEKLPEVGESFGTDEKIIETEKLVLDVEQDSDDVYDYMYYEILTQNIEHEDEKFEYYIAVKIDLESEIREECIGKTWKWCCHDDYYKALLTENMTAIDGRTGNEMTESGDCIVDLGLNLSVAGHIEIREDEDEITIADEAIVYSPES